MTLEQTANVAALAEKIRDAYAVPLGRRTGDDDKFEELDYPYDVLWLDIEHTDGKRYFTWDKNLFPHPTSMQEKLWSQGRRMVSSAFCLPSCYLILHSI